ncbi:choline dehydrogenase [Apiospora phragmitis]|uniref:Choline dehydrogenase n=1 Tax=Apiospora phragmitis TaxID=2905665 RepID=A0ABR1UK07_9PEZI
MYVLKVVVFFLLALSGYCRHNPLLPKQAELASDYEYVVVGSGPGGGPLAANLAAAGHKVLLIDAGGDYGDELVESVPAMFPFSTEYVETKWDFFATRSPDPTVEAQNRITSYRVPNGTVYTGLDPPAGAVPIGTLYPRAGTLGGCAQHNALIAIRAFDSDWDVVARKTGDASWNGQTFQDLYQKIENCDYLPNSILGHGFTGWFHTALTSLLTAVQDLKVVSIIVSAGLALGVDITTSLIGTVAGLAEILLKDNSKRGGARDRILEVANAVDILGNRKYHLDIKLETLVTKVNLDGDLRATGVSYMEGKSLYRADPRSGSATVLGEGTINATKEVIIAGGAFNTPQILKLSGIGPKDELSGLGIPVQVDLPGVGANLRDHIEISTISKSNKDFSLLNGCTFMQGYPEKPDPCLEQYLSGLGQTGKGVYATNGLAIGVALQSTAATQDDPDLWIYGGPANFPGFYPGWAADAVADHRHWAWITLKASTQNRAGTVTLTSTDPRDVPRIAFNTFQDARSRDQDLQAAYEGIRYARDAMDKLLPLDGAFVEETPGRANVSTEAEVKDWAATNSFGHHACCTAAIGGDGEAGAVLDANFSVRGTQGLRVVDASAFPVVPGFFIQVPTYLLAEKATKAILDAA